MGVKGQKKDMLKGMVKEWERNRRKGDVKGGIKEMGVRE